MNKMGMVQALQGLMFLSEIKIEEDNNSKFNNKVDAKNHFYQNNLSQKKENT